MKVVLLSLLFSISAMAAEGTKFKSFNEVRASTAYFITCSSKASGDQLHMSFLYGMPNVQPFIPQVLAVNFAVLSPSEALQAGSFGQLFNQQFNVQWTEAEMKFWGAGTELGHNVKLLLSMKDSTSGRFKGQLKLEDTYTHLTMEKEVVCGATNYSFPKP